MPYEVLRGDQRSIVPKVVSKDGTRHGYFYESLSVRRKTKGWIPS